MDNDIQNLNQDDTDFLQQNAQLSTQKLSCSNCNALLVYLPGTHFLVCTYCGFQQEIVSGGKKHVLGEIDYEDFIARKLDALDHQEVHVVRCNSCGATPILNPFVVAEICAFCGQSLVLANGSTSKMLKPQALLPFDIGPDIAKTLFKNWVKKLWFAPNSFLKASKKDEQLKGVYLPYWTFDSQTSSDYRGRRGVDYTKTESYTDSDGKRQTRTVTETHWSYVSGHIDYFCDDELVVASASLPSKWAKQLEPWDLKKLVVFDDRYLSGFYAEAYQLDLQKGYLQALDGMKSTVNRVICADIGGDHQKIDSVNTVFSQVTFKHILLPVWLSSYSYKAKSYRFFVNACTGEVQGERPYSWLKITFFTIFCLALLALFFLIVINL